MPFKAPSWVPSLTTHARRRREEHVLVRNCTLAKIWQIISLQTLYLFFHVSTLRGSIRAMDLTGAESWRWRGRERRYCRVNLADLEMRFVTCARLLPYPLLTKCFVSKSNHGATNHQQVILRMKSFSFHFHFLLCSPSSSLFFFNSLLYFFVDTVFWHYMRSTPHPPPPPPPAYIWINNVFNPIFCQNGSQF